MRDLALAFDGNNEDDMMRHFRRRHAVDPGSQNGVYLYGLLSEDERTRISEGLSCTYTDYLVDVSDTAGGPCMRLRSGVQVPIERRSIFVNCAGSFFRTSGMADRLPCISMHNTIASVNLRDGFHFLSSVAAFSITHLLYRGALRGKGFYTLDHEALFRQNRNAWVGASAAQAYMNQVLTVQTLPVTLLDRCGLDLDRWYPFPRRFAGLLRRRASARRDVAHYCLVLDRMAERFHVHCGPIRQGY
ncbi:hypothetical protein [Paracoccus rhizosphaerae]|uniref:FAD dependent oxidoreductase n=1 Tax=Paracoccus rhizosphaerae TaxID=1133347 RepID=A0ABV6CMI2_9RHOB|nr:hypothetical protein [Paracoccus rhizosphaerae]